MTNPHFILMPTRPNFGVMVKWYRNLWVSHYGLGLHRGTVASGKCLCLDDKHARLLLAPRLARFFCRSVLRPFFP